jgi:hypothetical protein
MRIDEWDHLEHVAFDSAPPSRLTAAAGDEKRRPVAKGDAVRNVGVKHNRTVEVVPKP